MNNISMMTVLKKLFSICIYSFFAANALETNIDGDHFSSLKTSTSVIELNYSFVNRPHPLVVSIAGSRTTAVSAKFRSLSSRPLDMWWDDGAGGVSQGRIMPGKETTTNSYEGHTFYFTDITNKGEVVDRITMRADTVLYPVRDISRPAPPEVLAKTNREESFASEYFARTGLKWRHYFGDDGPRPPPVLSMLPGDVVGQVHAVTTPQAYW